MEKIFISHSSLDEELVRSFVDRILILGLKMNPNKMFCTSIEGMNIKSGADFRKAIKEKLESSEVVIQLITENYKKSEVCLNEMGAAWVLNTLVIPFIVHPVKYNNIGFIHDTTQILRLNHKKDLLKFKDDHKEIFNSEKFEVGIYNQQIDDFLKIFKPEIQTYKTQHKKTTPTQHEIESYFNRFLEPDIDISSLMMKAQPNIADCRAIFSNEYAQEVYTFYSITYRTMFESNENWDQISTKDIFETKQIVKSDLEEGIKDNNRKKLFVDSVKSNATFYSVDFKQHGKEYGNSFSFWSYLNGRWVFFPKPWRIIYSISDLKSDESIKKMVRTINRFGIGKELKQEGPELEFLITHIISELKKNSK